MSKQGYIILGFVVLAIILFLGYILYNQNQKLKSLNENRDASNNSSTVNSVEESKTKATFDSVLNGLISNAANNPLTFESLASALEVNGIVVLREGQVSTMEYNPKRVTIREVAKQCVTTPCFNDFQLISIG